MSLAVIVGAGPGLGRSVALRLVKGPLLPCERRSNVLVLEKRQMKKTEVPKEVERRQPVGS